MTNIMVEGKMCEKFPSKLTNQTRISLRFFPQYIIRHKILKLETNVSPSSIISIFESRKTKFLSQRFNYSPNFKCNFAIIETKAEIVTRFVSFTNIKGWNS